MNKGRLAQQQEACLLMAYCFAKIKINKNLLASESSERLVFFNSTHESLVSGVLEVLIDRILCCISAYLHKRILRAVPLT